MEPLLRRQPTDGDDDLVVVDYGLDGFFIGDDFESDGGSAWSATAP